ncbi:unnamed protein product [Schistosoma turkestanicum]|nr:unnamed protein product [Schistosoma turkestanicum]
MWSIVHFSLTIGVAVKMIDALYRLPGLAALHADRSSVIRASQQCAMNSELAKLEYMDALNAFKNEGIKVLGENMSDQSQESDSNRTNEQRD